MREWQGEMGRDMGRCLTIWSGIWISPSCYKIQRTVYAKCPALPDKELASSPGPGDATWTLSADLSKVGITQADDRSWLTPYGHVHALYPGGALATW